MLNDISKGLTHLTGRIFQQKKDGLHGSELDLQKSSEKTTLVPASTTNQQSTRLDIQISNTESSEGMFQHCSSASGTVRDAGVG